MFKFELMVDYKLQEEDKQRRAEAERIMVENQKKIEEQQRKMVSTFAKVEFSAIIYCLRKLRHNNNMIPGTCNLRQ